MPEHHVRPLADIQHTLLLEASPEAVWKAIATAEGLSAWFMPNDFRPVLGADFTFQSEPAGEWDGLVHCQVTAIEPLRMLQYRWRGYEMDTTVTWTLMDTSGQTACTLVHSGWNANLADIRAILDEGWEQHALAGLAQWVSGEPLGGESPAED